MTARGKGCGNQGGGMRSGRGAKTQVNHTQDVDRNTTYPSELNHPISTIVSRPFYTEITVGSSPPGQNGLMKSAQVPAKYPNKGGDHFTKVLVASTLTGGKVIEPPKLKLSQNGYPCEVIVKEQNWDWKYSGNGFAEGKKLERWAVVNLSSNYLSDRDFIKDLRWRSRNFGMEVEEPAVIIRWGDSIYAMDALSSVEEIQLLLADIGKYCMGLQIIIFIMTKKHDSYGYLKWVLETKMGLISQFCLEKSYSSTKTKCGCLDHLCMKINGKIGGSNVELIKPLPHGSVGDHVVMLIGACKIHPEANKDETSSAIAAVVGTVNWPAANRYVARIKIQANCKRIVRFGAICKDLVNTFSEFNKVKPDKIVVFRDDVGDERELDRVVNREFRDLEKAISTLDHKPSVTLVLVHQRHHTRIFRDKGRGEIDTVLPAGTVVDTAIVHQSTDLDFYLCSNYNGDKITSKPTHYRVRRDQNSFSSHDLQKLIYHLCFTHSRSAKPASLVVPAYYANLAATRGRGYYEAAKLCKKESGAPTSSSSSSGNPSVQDEDCCRVHPNIANKMFFI